MQGRENEIGPLVVVDRTNFFIPATINVVLGACCGGSFVFVVVVVA